MRVVQKCEEDQKYQVLRVKDLKPGTVFMLRNGVVSMRTPPLPPPHFDVLPKEDKIPFSYGVSLTTGRPSAYDPDLEVKEVYEDAVVVLKPSKE